MADDPRRGDGGLALSGYEAKLLVTALCRYARASDVHDAHRDRCERLAGTLAGAGSVTLTLARDGPGGSADDPSGSRDGPADSGDRPARSGDASPRSGDDRACARDVPPRSGTDTPSVERPDDAVGGESAFRWGPDRADG